MDAAGRKRAAPEGANGAGGPKRARGERLPDLSLSLSIWLLFFGRFRSVGLVAARRCSDLRSAVRGLAAGIRPFCCGEGSGVFGAWSGLDLFGRFLFGWFPGELKAPAPL
jgi:hypothetical protein